MKHLTSNEKDQLEKAIESISDYCSDGMSPNDAIIKTAQTMKLTPDRLPILVNAYNAGATAEHWSSSDSLRDKVASFPIADIDYIRMTLYPNKVKKAGVSAPKRDSAFSRSPQSIYGSDVFDCYLPSIPAMQKAASKKSYEDRHKEADTLVKRGEALVREAKSAVNLAFEDLATEVCRRDTPSYDSLLKTASVVYGDKAARIMKCLAVEYPQVKRAKSYHSRPLPSGHPLFKALENACACVDKCADALNIYSDSLVKSAAIKASIMNEWQTELYGDEMKRTVVSAQKKSASEVKKK